MLKTSHLLFLSFFVLSSAVQAGSIDEKDVPTKKRTKAGLYVTSQGAYEILKKESDKTLFIDVRTRGEVAYVGMPLQADANIPFKFTSKKYKWNDKSKNFQITPNPDFVDAISKKAQQKEVGKNGKIFVMCRSGGRSAKAADALTKAGYTQVYSVIDGFEGDSVKSGDQKGKRTINGWKNSNLPWSYNLEKSKMYLSKKGKGKDKNKMLKKMDTNNDDIISQQEFDAFHKKMFGKIDHDHDGILDDDELLEFNKQKQENKHKEH